MAERFYLTVAEVLKMHRQLIEEFGGIHGVRDNGYWRRRCSGRNREFRVPQIREWLKENSRPLRES